MTRHVLVVLAIALAAPAAAASQPAPPAEVALPAPRTDGKVSVEKALKERRTLRTPASTPLTVEEVGQLCWAAQGLTDDKGHRAAPSAKALYPLELYVLVGAVKGLAPGLYRYEVPRHALKLVAAGDRRAEFDKKGVGQSWIATAPAVFVIAGSPKRMADAKERALEWMHVEVGLAAQGFFLQATALGLGSTFVGGFKPLEAKAALALPGDEAVVAVLPVGHRP